MTNLDFGERFRELRKQADKCTEDNRHNRLTQEMLVAKLDELTNGQFSYKNGQVNKWETGTRQIDAANRALLIGIIRVLYHYRGIKSLADANSLLAAGKYERLSKEELCEVEPEWLALATFFPRQPASETSFAYLPDKPFAIGLDKTISKVLAFLKNKPTFSINVLMGLGGVGKTVLAQHIVHRLINSGEPVVYITVESESSLSPKAKYRHFVRHLWERLSHKSPGKYSIAALQRNISGIVAQQPWTIVIDGLLTQEEVDIFCDKLSVWDAPAQILLTARHRPTASPNTAYLVIQDLRYKEAFQLLTHLTAKMQPHLKKSSLKEFIGIVGGNPLLLATVAGAIGRGYPADFLLAEIKKGSFNEFEATYEFIFSRIWQTLTDDQLNILFSFLFVAESEVNLTYLGEVSSLNNTLALIKQAMKLIDCAFLMPTQSGYQIQTLVRQYIGLKGGEEVYRPILLSLAHRAITFWLLQFEQVIEDQWHIFDAERHNFFQAIRTCLSVVPFAPVELHTDLVSLVRQVCRFVVRRGFAHEWFPLLQQVINNLPNHYDKQRCYLVTNLGLIGRTVEQVDIALKAHEEGLAIAVALNDQDEIAQSKYNLGICYELIGDWEKGNQFAIEAMTLCEELNNDHGIGACSNLLGMIALRSGNIKRAIPYFKTAAYYCDKQKIFSETARALINLCLALLVEGEYDQGLESLAEAGALLRDHPNESVNALLNMTKAAALIKLGEYLQADNILNRLPESQLEELGESEQLAMYLHYRGEITLYFGRFNEAIVLLEKSNTIWDELGSPIEQSLTLLNLVQAYIKQNELDYARTYYSAINLLLRDKKHFRLADEIQSKLTKLHPQLF